MVQQNIYGLELVLELEDYVKSRTEFAFVFRRFRLEESTGGLSSGENLNWYEHSSVVLMINQE